MENFEIRQIAYQDGEGYWKVKLTLEVDGTEFVDNFNINDALFEMFKNNELTATYGGIVINSPKEFFAAKNAFLSKNAKIKK